MAGPVNPPEVAVVVPVYNAARETARCLQALAATVPAGQSVILIDDGSTDPEIPRLLGEFRGRWQVIRRAKNRGFVATANEGLALAAPADVVLLNSDTVPAGRWLDRLRACVSSDSRIASATPFTNNGEIASLPEFCRANPLPSDPERWAAACLEAGPPEYPELPTAVGFCMYLRRACLDGIGDFDAEAFGRGYGEENDWCMRAAAGGWRHVLCDDAYVAHQGNASFGPEGLFPDESAMRRLLARHPDYLERVREFIDADPLEPVRRRVLDRLRSGNPGAH